MSSWAIKGELREIPELQTYVVMWGKWLPFTKKKRGLLVKQIEGERRALRDLLKYQMRNTDKAPEGFITISDTDIATSL